MKETGPGFYHNEIKALNINHHEAALNRSIHDVYPEKLGVNVAKCPPFHFYPSYQTVTHRPNLVFPVVCCCRQGSHSFLTEVWCCIT